jgi:hypothetical protein
MFVVVVRQGSQRETRRTLYEKCAITSTAPLGISLFSYKVHKLQIALQEFQEIKRGSRAHISCQTRKCKLLDSNVSPG